MLKILNLIRSQVNGLLSEYDAFMIITITLLTLFLSYIIYKVINDIKTYGIVGLLQLYMIRLLKYAPGGNKLIEAEKSKQKLEIINYIKETLPKSKNNFYELPSEPISREVLREEMLNLFNSQNIIKSNHAHGGLYSNIDYKYKLIDSANNFSSIINNFKPSEEAYLIFSHSNTLYPFLYPEIRKFEVEIVSMVAKLLNAPNGPCGNITSGGTESIFLALKCYRDYSRYTKNIKNANILLSKSAHPAFIKAAYYLNVEYKIVKFYKNTYTMDVDDLKKLIDKNTIVIIGSAPSFPHATIDDIPSICSIATKYNIPVHVDNCIGGFIINYLNELNIINKPFDFSVNGVTSISIDIHKNAGGAKGSSVILYNNNNIRKYQFYSYANWCGGLYLTSTFRGSANGGILASAWCTLLSTGNNNYKKKAMNLYKSCSHLIEELKKINHITVLGEPIGIAVSFNFDHLNCYAVGEALKDISDWSLGYLQSPAAIQFLMGERQIEQIDNFIKDLKKAIELVEDNPKKYEKGFAAIYGSAVSIPDRKLVEETCFDFLEAMSVPLD